MAAIQNDRELEFAIFCIENLSIKIGVSAEEVYEALTVKSDILNSYIVANYEALHTQGKAYILGDILEVMEERGVEV